jgi:hypothetical protein
MHAYQLCALVPALQPVFSPGAHDFHDILGQLYGHLRTNKKAKEALTKEQPWEAELSAEVRPGVLLYLLEVHDTHRLLHPPSTICNFDLHLCRIVCRA